MLLTALALFDAPCDLPNRMTALAKQLDDVLSKFAAGPRPDRVVYVGAGPLAFAAREAALKVMELSAGQFPHCGIARWDFAMGQKHLLLMELILLFSPAPIHQHRATTQTSRLSCEPSSLMQV